MLSWPLSSCARDSEDARTQLADALLACGLLTPGQPPARVIPDDPFERCILECVAESTCGELEQLLCNGDMALLEGCEMQCIQAQGYTCEGQTFPPDRVCDGIVDCGDGSDEVDCPPPFTCDDGYEIAPRLRCDGIPDCFDASDEVGCPESSSATCADGTPLPPMWRCDEKQDCLDGSDEIDCAMGVCPTSAGSP